MKKFAMNKDQLMGGGASASPWGGGGYGGSSAVGPSTSWKPPSEEESLEQLQKRIDDHDSAIKDSLHRTTAMANQTREVGAATLRDIHMQGEQLKGIAANQQKAQLEAAGGSGWRREQVYGGGSAAPVTDECDALSQISSIVGDLKLQADAMNKELKLQSGQLDAIDSKADRNASQLEATNMRTKKLSRR